MSHNMLDSDKSDSGDERNVPAPAEPKGPKSGKEKPSEKEEHLKERERKKEQALLDKALKQSTKDAKKSSSGRGERERTSGLSSSFSSKSDISALSNILIDGFKGLRHEFRGLKSHPSEGFSSLNENLEYGFDSFYYEEPEHFGLGGTSVGMNARENGDVLNSDVQAPDLDSECAGSPLAESLGGSPGIMSLFTKLASEIVMVSETGENVSPDLARLVNEHCIHPVSLEGFIQMKNSYKRPENCEQLQVPTVPEVIWNRLDGTSLGRDKASQSVQDDFLAVISAIVQALQRLGELQAAFGQC